ncbi:hypothetical protein JOH52_002404 [Sinorhizobium meliloti]|nr:hypothetical protein [Sinorhizobium meliloti]
MNWKDPAARLMTVKVVSGHAKSAHKRLAKKEYQ